ncbi:hypothetical protein D3C84_1307100 [compost metagenome]
MQGRQYESVQQDAVIGQQHDNDHLGVKLRIHEVLQAFVEVVDADDGSACHP